MIWLDSERLRTLFDVALRDAGASESSSGHVVNSVVDASLRGVDSHGIRLLPHYVRVLRSGRVNGAPRFTWSDAGHAVARMDADHGFGHHAGADAMTPEEIFSSYATGDNDYFRVTPLGAGGSYTAEDRLTAGYAMAVLPLTRTIEVIAGDWRSAILTDKGIRELTQRARFVVVPLVQTVHPAGQSATLQAMACGKPTILTRSQAIWDDSVLVHRHSCMLVTPGSVEEMRQAVREIAADAGLRSRMGACARAVVTGGYHCERMADALGSILSESRARALTCR